MSEPRQMLERLLKSSDLAQAVARLQPAHLHRVIRTCGLEDCAEIVAVATPDQLARIFDLDLWRVGTAGADEQFDAARFGLWLSVLMESGAAVAADKLAALDVELAVAGFARHIAVFDHAAISSYTTLDGEQVQGRTPDHASVSEVGGYVVGAKRTSAWEPIVDLLAFLHVERPEYFHRLMRGCVELSNAPREEDGLHDLAEDREQHMLDVTYAREARQERQGYVTPAQAHAFLRESRGLHLDAEQPPASAIARAYLETMQPMDHDEASLELESDGFAAPPRALLGDGDQQAPRLAFVQAHVAAHPASAGELAYLTNAALAAGSIQSRPLTPREASEGVVSTCNLGLENWPPRWNERNLITAFQIGWTALHRDVCVYAARQLARVLGDIRCADRDIDLRLDGLRRHLIQHARDGEPWHVRNELEVIMMLDAPCWAALLALLDEWPVVHAALRASRQRRFSIDPTAFEFVSHNGDIAAIREFMASLPSHLAG